jgi:RNA polymerase sigma factor (sigma-70 family)
MTEHPEKFPQTLAELGEFIKKNQNRLVRHAFFKLGNREEAEDVVQEVMIRIYQERENKQHIEQATSYAFRMVFNACLDQLRKKAKNNFEQLNGKEVRVYTFDKSTNLLKSLEVYIEADNKEIEILQLTTIKYDEPVADSKFVITLPANVKWVPFDRLINDKHTGLAGVSSEEATKRFFEAWQKEDWKTVDQLMPGFMNSIDVELVKHEYGGLTILSIGKPFKSGQYPGEFVPYSIRLKSGNIKKMNLALRRDNPEKKWWVDGGF